MPLTAATSPTTEVDNGQPRIKHPVHAPVVASPSSTSKSTSTTSSTTSSTCSRAGVSAHAAESFSECACQRQAREEHSTDLAYHMADKAWQGDYRSQGYCSSEGCDVPLVLGGICGLESPGGSAHQTCYCLGHGGSYSCSLSYEGGTQTCQADRHQALGLQPDVFLCPRGCPRDRPSEGLGELATSGDARIICYPFCSDQSADYHYGTPSLCSEERCWSWEFKQESGESGEEASHIAEHSSRTVTYSNMRAPAESLFEVSCVPTRHSLLTDRFSGKVLSMRCLFMIMLALILSLVLSGFIAHMAVPCAGHGKELRDSSLLFLRTTTTTSSTVETRIGQAHAHAHQRQQGHQPQQGHRQHQLNTILGHQCRERREADIDLSHLHRPIGDPTGIISDWAKISHRHPHQKYSLKILSRNKGFTIRKWTSTTWGERSARHQTKYLQNAAETTTKTSRSRFWPRSNNDTTKSTSTTHSRRTSPRENGTSIGKMDFQHRQARNLSQQYHHKTEKETSTPNNSTRRSTMTPSTTK